ncbi:MAG TPA: MarR family transcriptional regulator [Candidatus Acidoferrales bacterium]|jgi:DNA-binding MarR family transcriptional regulator|nr:MarR family transcriptional regulator [Candidatus Acidoferrales bacterium]
MSRTVTSTDYQALAEFRYLIRRFLNTAEQDARALGLEPQQYLLLLAVRGLPSGARATIGNLAERLHVRHHSAVELIDRLAKRGLVRRVRGMQDRRHVLVHLTTRGRSVLAQLAQKRLRELRTSGPDLVRTLNAVITRQGNEKKTRTSRGADQRGRKWPGEKEQ